MATPTPVHELITLITSVPPFISPEEHRARTSSTPASFADIPPVVRHQEVDVAVQLDPPLEGLAPEDLVRGTLYVIESVLAFVSASGSGRGFTVEYPHITLHAISRADGEAPSIYCQLDDVSADDDEYAAPPPLPRASAPGASTANGLNGHVRNEEVGDEEEEEEEENEATANSTLRELKITPRNGASLEPIFEALSLCAALHPDAVPDSDDDDDMGADDAFLDADEAHFETFAGDGAQELSEVGRAALEYLESIICDPHVESEDDGAGTRGDGTTSTTEGERSEGGIATVAADAKSTPDAGGSSRTPDAANSTPDTKAKE